MSNNQQVTYGVDFCGRSKGRRTSKRFSVPQLLAEAPAPLDSPDRATHGTGDPF